jgi:predicted Zn finger-like uncharacterized protein
VIIVTCPKCHSKFRFSSEGLKDSTVKMRCSVCAHIFAYTIEPEASVEKEFETLLSSRQESIKTSPQEVSAEEEITESPLEETPGENKQEDTETQPESVMREIDSILGSGTEIAEEVPLPVQQKTKQRSPLIFMLLVIALLAIGLSILWFYRDKLPFYERPHHDKAQVVLERGPYFTIPENKITYELLTHEKEGSVLVVKGGVRKLTPKTVESILIEARVYDSNGKQLESRLAYAGIVPDTSEFTRQAGKDIEALLTSQPATPGSSIPSEDIPFAVAFFGRPAQEAASFQIEVKEFHWK